MRYTAPVLPSADVTYVHAMGWTHFSMTLVVVEFLAHFVLHFTYPLVLRIRGGGSIGARWRSHEDGGRFEGVIQYVMVRALPLDRVWESAQFFSECYVIVKTQLQRVGCHLGSHKSQVAEQARGQAREVE